MQKKCRKCKDTKNILEFPSMNMGKFGVGSTCFECIKDNHKKYLPIKLSQKPINKVSKTNKNTIAKFSSKTKAEILIRDKHCIFCNKAIQDYHHIYFGGNAEYGEDRNDSDKGVGVCRFHHNKFHHAGSGDSKKMKEYSIKYINDIKIIRKL